MFLAIRSLVQEVGRTGTSCTGKCTGISITCSSTSTCRSSMKQNANKQGGRFAFVSAFSSLSLNSPTSRDADELLARMNHRHGSVVTNADVLNQYNIDWPGKFKGHSQILLRPQNTLEVSKVLQYCHEKRIGVVPQAGNTGLVGGSVPIADEIILSVQGLKNIEGLNKTSGILKCDAGVILQDLQDYAAQHKFMVPVDLAAKGTCCIGGNVSTNAGGQYFYRHGSLHANVLGLEVVLPDGKVLDLITSVHLKDNTGYDLKQLFIGAEGTLGIITKVALHCPRLPQARNVAFLACSDFSAVQKLLTLSKDVLGEVLAAFEFMDQGILDVVGTELRIPISPGDGKNYPYCVLVETQGSNVDHDMAKMESFLEQAIETGYCVDGVLAQDLTQINDMWDVRESTGPGAKSAGYVYKYDFSLPIAEFEELANEMRKRLQNHPETIVVNWGHIVDGNLHLNIITPGTFEEDPALTQ